MLICFNSNADTNLGTINTVRNGFATIKECESKQQSCDTSPFESLKDVLNLTTTNMCISSHLDFKHKGISIPNCPSGNDQIKGLDNTYPTAGMFAIYADNDGYSDSFIYDLVTNFLRNNKVGRFNLVVPLTHIKSLRSNPKLLKVLNSKRVNIITVKTTPAVERWMQDGLQFTTINGKPALYQLEYEEEVGKDLKDRFACEIARNCNIPYYIPPDMVDPRNKEIDGSNEGGNYEVLPGGSFMTGIVKSNPGRKFGNIEDKLPYRSKFQQILAKSLKASGNNIVELDTSFLSVGHVDELFNVVKTNRPPPCNFAILSASPYKAFELMRDRALEREKMNEEKQKTKNSYIQNSLQNIVISNAFARDDVGAIDQLGKMIQVEETSRRRCRWLGLHRISYASREIMSPATIERIYRDDCIDGQNVEKYVSAYQFRVYEQENLGINYDIYRRKIKCKNILYDRKVSDNISSNYCKYGSHLEDSDLSVASIMEQNKVVLENELKRTTGCQSPTFIDIPVFFRSGVALLPNLVNGLVETPPGVASNVYLPRTYFRPFDEYVQKELAKYGVNTSFISDLEHHRRKGDVHCGTNSARICN